MKPTELSKEFSKDEYLNAYAEANRLFARYKNEDCVIAYRKCFMGVAMVIRGKKDYFGFVIINDNVTKWRNAELQRKELVEIQRLFNSQDKNELVIVDQELYKIFERKVLFNAI